MLVENMVRKYQKYGYFIPQSPQIVNVTSKWPSHDGYSTPSSIQELHQHGQAIAGVIMLILTSLHEQRHFLHERTVFLAAVRIVNEIEFLHIRRVLDNAAQLALCGRRFFCAHVDAHTI